MSKNQITPDLVKKIATLAKLSLSEEEVNHFTPQLDQIFGYIDQLSEVDTANTPPTAQISGLHSVTRSDQVDEVRVLSSDQATSGSDSVVNDYFVVDAVINAE